MKGWNWGEKECDNLSEGLSKMIQDCSFWLERWFVLDQSYLKALSVPEGTPSPMQMVKIDTDSQRLIFLEKNGYMVVHKWRHENTDAF